MAAQAVFEAIVATKAHSPQCSWPLNIISTSRELDFSQCFEYAVLLPQPLVLATFIALTRILVIKSQLKSGKTVWQERLRGSRRLCTAKVVSGPLSPLHRGVLIGTDPVELELSSSFGGTWLIIIYGQRESIVDTQLRLVSRRSAGSFIPHLPESLHISSIVRPDPPILASVRHGLCYSNPNDGPHWCPLHW